MKIIMQICLVVLLAILGIVLISMAMPVLIMAALIAAIFAILRISLLTNHVSSGTDERNAEDSDKD